MPISDLLRPVSTAAPDFFSSDYLSVTASPFVRDAFLRNLASSPRILGSGGSRLGTGNTDAYTYIEERLRNLFGGPGCQACDALLFNSGYDANRVFWSTVPQKGDAIVFDSLVHVSMKDGMLQSRAGSTGALYPFEHNSVVAFKERVGEALKKHPNIAEGKGTLFVAVETLYSMDGDFARLREIFEAADELIPAGCAHLMVDEAHTTGLFGPDGRGLLFELGLETRVDTVLHTFSKAWGMSGGVIMTSPLIRRYLIMRGKPVMFSTALPYSHICGLNTVLEYVTSTAGTERRERVRQLCSYFSDCLARALQSVSPKLLRLDDHVIPSYYRKTVVSPIFPILTPAYTSLADFLGAYGYAVTAIGFPAVPRGQERIRVTIHAGNTEAELDEFISCLMRWASGMQNGKQLERSRL
ncbi:PLP-dependent transferase [Dichomitus squalens]|uniref:PLP-dependent transferase n=1 Tax=Dichomitus squalens TaxID=114155 RepID=A0A4Q9MKT8_9APHY|nr:PLP-dependent transferase [Dichomitus squalens]